MMIDIRPPRAEDLPEVLALAAAFHREATTNFPKPEPDRILQTFHYVWTNPSLYGRVVEQDGVLVGLCIASITDSFFSSELQLYIHDVYIEPSSRNGRAAIKLFKDIDNFARSKNAKRVFMAYSSGIKSDRAIRFLEHMGFQIIGAELQKVLS